LSGLSGVSAGICALIGAWIAHGMIQTYVQSVATDPSEVERLNLFQGQMVILALAVLLTALVSSTWFTWRKARKGGLPIWDHASKKLAINMAIPLAAGGFFVLGLLSHKGWNYVAPSCLVFYGLALVNASKYTLTDIRYLGFLEIVLGCICIYYPHEALYFWAVGFGALHIVYGLIMWWKYEKS